VEFQGSTQLMAVDTASHGARASHRLRVVIQGSDYWPCSQEFFTSAIFFLDISIPSHTGGHGSGKGKVLFLAALEAFTTWSVSSSRLSCMRLRWRTSKHFDRICPAATSSLIAMDAQTFVFPDVRSWFLYNPFDSGDPEKYGNLTQSFLSSPGIYVVYLKPLHRGVIEDNSTRSSWQRGRRATASGVGDISADLTPA